MRTSWLLQVAVLVCACTGEIVRPPTGSELGSDGTGAGGGTDPTHPDMPCVTQGAPVTTGVRRLTTLELTNTLTVLLGAGASSALANVDGDSVVSDGFTNAQELTVSDSFVTNLNLAAAALGTTFKATVKSPAFASTCFASDSAARTCAQTFIESFGKKAYRRALSTDDVTALLAVYDAGREVGIDGNASDRFSTGLSWVVQAIAQSPELLYVHELGDPAVADGALTALTGSEIASNLSYAVLGRPPDDALLAAGESGALASADQRAAQAQRLITQYPTEWKQQMRLFVLQWLNINFSRPEWAKDTAAVPMFSSALKGALVTETNMWVDDWATSASGPTLDALLTSPATFVNSVNAPLYGKTATGSTFNKVSMDPAQRAGLLTFAGFLGSTTHVAETSPVQRGKAVKLKLLCTAPPAPPAVIPPLPPPDHSAPTTTRARYDKHLTDASCSNCHGTFQPMGDAFEGYDVIGAWRSTENGFTVDTTGALVGLKGGDVKVASAVELTNLLAQRDEVKDCFEAQAFRFTLGRKTGDHDACEVQDIGKKLKTAPLDARSLVGALVASDAFVTRTVHIAP